MEPVQAIMAMAREVSNSGSCVLEVIMYDDIFIASLVPIDEWDEEDEDDLT